MAFADACQPQIDLCGEIISLLSLGKGDSEKKILDVGCGTGKDLIRMRKEGFDGELFGIDIAEGILSVAQRTNTAEKTSVHFSRGDAEKLPFPDASFDTIIFKHSLQNVYQPRTALLEAKRVLKHRGRIAVVVNGEKTRLILRSLRPQLARVMRLESFPDSDKHFNLETTAPMVREVFKSPQVVTFSTEVRFTSSKPYLDYVDSTRSFWGDVSDQDWRGALFFAEEYFEKMLRQKGEIRDHVTIGIIVGANN